MKYLGFILVSLLIFFSSCGRAPEAISIGDEATIKFNKSAFLYDDGSELEIRFKSLVEESRCQPGMTCFWEGRAIVEIPVTGI